MYRSVLSVFALCPVLTHSLAAAPLVQIDFGVSGQQSPAASWNNVTVDLDEVPEPTTLITDLIDSNGNPTGAGFVFVSNAGSAGPVDVSYTAATGDAATLDANAVRDLFFVNIDSTNSGAGAEAVFRFTGLTAPVYDLSLFAALNPSRSNTVYTINGVSQSISPTGNTDFVDFLAIAPTAGTIEFTITRGGSDAAYINALTLTAIPEPASLMLLAAGSLVLSGRRRSA
ncbi:MAG: PEP-CTERM sorting domain-containing protein [Planctomycetota bacterium]